jgi:hypothetical protein
VTWVTPAGATGALEAIAGQAAKGIGAQKGAAMVVSAPLVTDTPAPKGDELAARVAQLVAGAMGGAAHASPQTATLAQARAVAAKDGALVFVQTEIAKGALRATVDVYPVPSNGWDRVRVPAPPPRAHAFAQAPVDAEVRAFLPSIPLERASVHKATHGEGDVIAAACGDLDGDGGMELALVSRARVAIGHVEKGAFAPSKTAAWSALAPRVSVPLREPLGGAAFVVDAERTTLLAGTTDRGGVALDATLALVGALRGIPMAAATDACAAPSPEASAFEGDAIACATSAKTDAPRVTAPTPKYDALAAADVIGADGKGRAITIARGVDGKLVARIGDASATLDGAGAQVAVADLDQDGTPEIVAAAAAPDADDAISVWSWDARTDPQLRSKIAAPGGVRALCACPPEQGGAPALVAVVGGEVWIVR